MLYDPPMRLVSDPKRIKRGAKHWVKLIPRYKLYFQNEGKKGKGRKEKKEKKERKEGRKKERRKERKKERRKERKKEGKKEGKEMKEKKERKKEMIRNPCSAMFCFRMHFE